MMGVDVACATSRHSDYDSAVRAPCDVAGAGCVDRVSAQATEGSLVAVLAVARGCTDPGLPVRRRGCADGGDPVAVHRIELVHPRAAVAVGAVQRHRVLRPPNERRRGGGRRGRRAQGRPGAAVVAGLRAPVPGLHTLGATEAGATAEGASGATAGSGGNSLVAPLF